MENANTENAMVALTDAEGNELIYEILDVIELDGKQYAVLLPEEEEGDIEREVTILELLADGEDGEETLSGIEDPELLDRIFALFLEKEDAPEE